MENPRKKSGLRAFFFLSLVITPGVIFSSSFFFLENAGSLILTAAAFVLAKYFANVGNLFSCFFADTAMDLRTDLVTDCISVFSSIKTGETAGMGCGLGLVFSFWGAAGCLAFSFCTSSGFFTRIFILCSSSLIGHAQHLLEGRVPRN